MVESTVDVKWLREFTNSFEQFVEGEDGERIGRAIWKGRDEEWRQARQDDSNLGYEDALAEANAWDDVN